MFCVIFEADVSTGLQDIGELRKKWDTMMQIRSIRSARCQADKKQLKKRFGISCEPNPVLELAVDPHEYYAPHNVACKSTLLFPYLGLHLWRCCIPCCWALINTLSETSWVGLHQLKNWRFWLAFPHFLFWLYYSPD